MSIAYLNGQFLPLHEARVPVLDRGYLFGDGVYEVMPAYGGRIFRLDQHLQRLERSLQAIRMAPPITSAQWQDILGELLKLNAPAGEDQAVYLQVTRGVAPTRTHGLPKDCVPSLLAFTWPLPALSASVREQGVSAISQPDNRWHRCDIKAIALLANVMLADAASSAGHNEAILHRDGMLTEGASSNVFLVKGDEVFTPPCSELILHGVTREFILELARQSGLTCHEQPVAFDALFDADEVWISSSTRELYPVTRLDGHPIGVGKPGQHWQAVYDLYQQHKRGA